MTATASTALSLGEFHPFNGSGRRFLYLVPAGAIFEVDDAVALVIDRLSETSLVCGQLVAELAQRGVASEDAHELIVELLAAGVIVNDHRPVEAPQNPPTDFPLQTLVLNLTNQCNLSCQYCYEFGADKLATPDGKP